MASKVTINITAKDNASSAFARVSAQAETMRQRFDRLGRSMMSTGRTMTVGMTVPIVAGFGSMIKAAQESNKISAITAQIIKSTGGAAKLTASQISAMSTALSNKTGIDDEAIQKGQNLLLTFTKVRDEAGKGNDVFSRASAAMLDLGTVFGSTDAAALQLGKALNDPEKGISALSRAGVQFTAQQKDQIGTMLAANDILGAQKLILTEIETQVGGTAAASATGYDKMKVAVGNMAETLGNVLVPFLEKASKWVSEWATKFDQLSPKTKNFIVIAGLLLAALGPIVTVLGAVVTMLGFLSFPVVALGLFGAAFVTAYRKSQEFRDVVDGVVKAVKGFVSGLATAAKMALGGEWGKAWDAALVAVRKFGGDVEAELDKVDWTGLAVSAHQFGLDLAAEAETWALNVAVSLRDYDWFALGAKIWGLIWDGMKSGFDSGKGWLKQKSLEIADLILPGSQFADKMKASTKRGMDAGRDAIVTGGVGWVSAQAAVGENVKAEANKFGQPFTAKAKADLNGAVGAFNVGNGQMSAAGARLKASLVAGLGSGGAGAAWAAAVISGMVNGLAGGSGRVAGAAAAMVSSALQAGKNAQAQASPSKKWYEVGEFAVEGMALGIEARTPRAVKSAAKSAKDVTAGFLDGVKSMAGRVAAAAAEIGERFQEAIGGAMGGYNAGKSKRSAERDLTAATRELAEARTKAAGIPARIALAERRLADALAGGEETSKDVADAQRDLDDLRREAVSNASDLERAELGLVDAQDRLAEATIAAYEAQQDLNALGPEAISTWMAYALAAGVAADQVDRMAKAMRNVPAGGGGGVVPPGGTGTTGGLPPVTLPPDFDWVEYWKNLYGGATVKYASGGFVRARPGGQMATIGEGGQDEIVSPIPMLRDIVRTESGGGGTTIHVTVQGNVMDGRDLANAVARGLRDSGWVRSDGVVTVGRS
jgi:hypothetical protein